MYIQSLDGLKKCIEGMPIEANEQLMIFAADGSHQDVKEMIDFLNEKNINFFGGIFPSLLVGATKLSKGFIIQKHRPVFTTVVLPFLMPTSKLKMEELEDTTAFVIVDGLSSKMKALTDTVFSKLGNKTTYIGGGAGFSDLQHRPCIFNNKGLHNDVLMLCIVKGRTNLEVNHGWHRLEGPFYVTKSEDNRLMELDSENAFEVYKHVIEQEESIILYQEDFFEFAKDHPFGIVTQGGADIVRDPIALNDKNEIIGVANIPIHSQVYVLKGNQNTLLASSLEIAEECAKDIPNSYIPLLFDCISRALFLEKKFDEELRNIQSKFSVEVEGALSIGEIASVENGYLEIHNKSTVLGLLER